ncbi:MAG TPA: type II secretion system protein [Candidatus Dormibacteraeota bacterium]
MGRRTSRGEVDEGGFTLAGVLVILSIMLIFLAYTVPRQWSAIMQRDREQQTIYAMQQYARACEEFRRKNNTYPVSPNQLKEARSPRMIRSVTGEIIDPLTGEYDWLVISQAQAASIPGANPNAPPGTQNNGNPGFNPSPQNPIYNPNPPAGTNPQTGTTGTNPNGTPSLPGIPIKDYAGGPFVGVRPPVSGKAMLTLNGNDTYETWSYTALDLAAEIQRRAAGLSIVYK